MADARVPVVQIKPAFDALYPVAKTVDHTAVVNLFRLEIGLLSSHPGEGNLETAEPTGVVLQNRLHVRNLGAKCPKMFEQQVVDIVGQECSPITPTLKKRSFAQTAALRTAQASALALALSGCSVLHGVTHVFSMPAAAPSVASPAPRAAMHDTSDDTSTDLSPVNEDAAQLALARQKWTAGDEPGAVRIWQELALTNNPKAWYNLGQAYRQGRGTALNLEAALTAYRLAAKFGNSKATEQLGLTLYTIPARRAEGLAILSRAADAGSPYAAYVIGFSQATGEGLPRDPDEALRHLSFAARHGIDAAWNPLTILRAQMLDGDSAPVSNPKVASGATAPTPSILSAAGTAAAVTTKAISSEPRTPQPTLLAHRAATSPNAEGPAHTDAGTGASAAPSPASTVAATPALPASISFAATHPMTLDQIASELARFSGRTVTFTLGATDDFKRADITHRLRITWTGPVEDFARKLAALFRIGVTVEPTRITFTSLPAGSAGQ